MQRTRKVQRRKRAPVWAAHLATMLQRVHVPRPTRRPSSRGRNLLHHSHQQRRSNQTSSDLRAVFDDVHNSRFQSSAVRSRGHPACAQTQAARVTEGDGRASSWECSGNVQVHRRGVAIASQKATTSPRRSSVQLDACGAIQHDDLIRHSNVVFDRYRLLPCRLINDWSRLATVWRHRAHLTPHICSGRIRDWETGSGRNWTYPEGNRNVWSC